MHCYLCILFLLLKKFSTSELPDNLMNVRVEEPYTVQPAKLSKTEDEINVSIQFHCANVKFFM